MKHLNLLFLLVMVLPAGAQTDPAVTSWLQNTTGITGSHYVNGNSTLIEDNIEANVQMVQYSDNWVYISTHGIPAYPTGPFLDGNPSVAQDQDAIYRIRRNPTPAANNSSTTPGPIGVFINGVVLFDYRDGVSWNNNTQAEGGGPIMGPPGQGIWNRDAVVAEREGFDCAKGHPAMGQYHHHQNPSAFDLDLIVLSDICNTYAADGLYAIDPAQHSPLLGFAADGYPVYGAYGYLNTDGTGGIVRVKSGYQLRDITARTHYADGTDVTDGPPINATYPLGRYREDYEWISHPEPDYLDVHNGRFCVTPEYPEGTYAYFCTVDENWNSAYPYAVGPTFYGTTSNLEVNSITEPVETYTGSNNIRTAESLSLSVYPNPASEFVAIQAQGIVLADNVAQLYDMQGRLVATTTLRQGSTIAWIDIRTLYNGEYVLMLRDGTLIGKVVVAR